MKGRVVALGRIKGQNAAALLEDGRLSDLFVDGNPDTQPAPGTIFRAICDRPIKGSGGMFLRLPNGGRGFMRQAKDLRPGARVLVQTTGYAEPEKAVPVTPRLIFKSRYAIVTPGAAGLNISRTIRDEEERVRLREIAEGADLAEGDGLILRSQCESADDDAIAEDIARMAEVSALIRADQGTGPERLLDGPDAHARGWAEWPAPEVFDDSARAFEDHGILEMIDELRTPRIALGPAHAYIEPTRALVAVDVNTGNDGSLAAGLKANVTLARDLPRQLRCRGLGGQIVLDLAPMPKKDRKGWEQQLRAAFRHDPVETALAGWTPLGHFELQRKRERLPLAPLI